MKFFYVEFDRQVKAEYSEHKPNRKQKTNHTKWIE